MENLLNIPQTVPIDAVAERLGVSAWTVRTWLRHGRFPYFKIGRRVLIRTEDIERLLSENFKPAVRPLDNVEPIAKAPKKRPRPA